MKKVNESILNILVYFDLFDHPLAPQEVLNFIDIKTNLSDVIDGLEELRQLELVFSDGQFYGLSVDSSQFDKRNKYNDAANSIMPLAIRTGEMILKFPFVEDVFISGSLSKYVMAADSDIDYFIITKSKRIWLCKLMLKFYKFFKLNNDKNHFCINYFISKEDLKIYEENKYTAIELATLIPVTKSNLKQQLVESNLWLKEILPQYEIEDNGSIDTVVKTNGSYIIENLFPGIIGTLSNKVVKNLSITRNKIKYFSLRNSKDFKLMMRSTDHQIKVHNSNHQRRILDLYTKKLKEKSLELKHVALNA